MDVTRTEIPGVLLIKPKVFGDHRGFFCETYNRRLFAEHGLHIEFVQDNQAFSARAGVLRGLHFQTPPMAQTKLVRVVRGSVFDVVVDLRKGSPSYGRWQGYPRAPIRTFSTRSTAIIRRSTMAEFSARIPILASFGLPSLPFFPTRTRGCRALPTSSPPFLWNNAHECRANRWTFVRKSGDYLVISVR